MDDGAEKQTEPPAVCVEDGAVAKTFRRTVGCKKVNYHLIRKCQTCMLYKTKNKSCFSMGHRQKIRTVRLSEDERHFETLDGKTLLHTDGHNYYRIKPGSRLLAWNDGKVEEISFADACTLTTVCLAPGTMLQHAPRSQIFSAYLNSSEPEELVDYTIPEMPKPRLMHSAGRSDKVDSDCSLDRIDWGDDESSRGRKRRKSARKMASTGEITRKGSRRNTPGGSGGRKQVSSAEDNACDTDVTEPSVSVFETKNQVHKALAVKLEACKEREVELKRVIDKAHADLEENNKSKRMAIQECNDQILAIIERREAYAAHCEDLAAQARAQNISDRESLQARCGELSVDNKSLPSVETAADTRVSSAVLAAAPSSALDMHDNVHTKSGEPVPRARVPSVPMADASPRVAAAPPKGPNTLDEEESTRVGKEQGARSASDELAGRAEIPPTRNAEASTRVAVKSEAPTVSDMGDDMPVDWEVRRPGTGELLGNEGLPSAPAAEASVQAAAAVAASMNMARRWAIAHIDQGIVARGSQEPGNGGERLPSAPTTEPPRLLMEPPPAPVVSLTDDRRQADREKLQEAAGERSGYVDATPPSMALNAGAPVWAVAVSPMPCTPEKMEERFQIGGTGKASRTTRTPSLVGTTANKGMSVFYPQRLGTGIDGSGGRNIGAAASSALLLGSPPPPSLASIMSFADSRSRRGAARSAYSPLPSTASMFARHTSAVGGAGSDGQQVTTTTSLRALPHAPMLWPRVSGAASSASNDMRVPAVPSVPLLSRSAPLLSLPPQLGLHWSQTRFGAGGSQSGASAAPTVHFPLEQRPIGTDVVVSGSHPVGEVDGTNLLPVRSASPSHPSRVEGTVGDDDEVNGAVSVP